MRIPPVSAGSPEKSGKPLGDGNWTLTLKATRDASLIQNTSYTAKLR